MGVISHTIWDTYNRVDGYPCEETTYYVYCDKCGSFKIQHYTKITQWLLLILLITTVAVCWNYLFVNKQHGIKLFVCWASYIFFTAGIFGLLSRYIPHKCMKCGNTNITDQNVKNYSEDDLNNSIDVPVLKLHKHENNQVENSFRKDTKDFLLFIPVLIIILIFPIFMPFIFLFESLKEFLHAKKKKN